MGGLKSDDHGAQASKHFMTKQGEAMSQSYATIGVEIIRVSTRAKYPVQA